MRTSTYGSNSNIFSFSYARHSVGRVYKERGGRGGGEGGGKEREVEKSKKSKESGM